MPTLEILVGLSGSGKSTYAERADAAVVSRDSLRVALFGSDHQDYYEHPDVRAREDAVTVAEHAAIAGALSAGLDVVHDATNLTPRFTQKVAEIGFANNARVKTRLFDVPLETALERNRKRGLMGGRLVPEHVIRKQHERMKNMRNWKPREPVVPALYVPDTTKPKAFLVDIDGTLAHMNGKRGPFDWQKVYKDDPDRVVIDAVNRMYESSLCRDDDEILPIAFSGRDSVCRDITEEWLHSNGLIYHDLFMREEGDMRKDSIVKSEMFDKYIRDNYNVQFVIDDRWQVCQMWLTMGLKVFNVSGIDRGEF